MNDAVSPMSDRTADTLLGARFAEDIESSFFHQKLLQTHFDPSLERLAGILELLNEQEAVVDAFDTMVAESDALVRAQIAAIADPALFVLDDEEVMA